MKCPRCKQENLSGSLRCIHCGAVFGEVIEQTLAEAHPVSAFKNSEEEAVNAGEKVYLNSWMTAKEVTSLEYKLSHVKQTWDSYRRKTWFLVCSGLVLMLVVYYVALRVWPEWDGFGLRGASHRTEKVQLF